MKELIPLKEGLNLVPPVGYYPVIPMYILERSQFLPVAVEKVWDFIKDPANLDIITPTDLKFSIVTPLPDDMYDGLIIEYRVTVPIFGRQQWVTEIKHIRRQQSFVDEQRIGPYRFWYHYHELQQKGACTTMIDRVHYKLPFGPFGILLHSTIIRKTLNRIFDYRQEQLTRIFSSDKLFSA